MSAAEMAAWWASLDEAVQDRWKEAAAIAADRQPGVTKWTDLNETLPARRRNGSWIYYPEETEPGVPSSSGLIPAFQEFIDSQS